RIINGQDPAGSRGGRAPTEPTAPAINGQGPTNQAQEPDASVPGSVIRARRMRRAMGAELGVPKRPRWGWENIAAALDDLLGRPHEVSMDHGVPRGRTTLPAPTAVPAAPPLGGV